MQLRNSLIFVMALLGNAVFGYDPIATQSLETAVLAGSVDDVKTALTNGANPNSVIYYGDVNGEPCLSFAASSGNLPVVVALLDAGVDVTLTGVTDTSLMEATLLGARKSGNFAVFDELIKRGLGKQRLPDGRSFLMLVAEAGDKASVAHVLAAGQDPKARDSKGMTALDYAMESNENVDVIGFLLPMTIPPKELPSSPIILLAFDQPSMGTERPVLTILQMYFSAGSSPVALAKAGVPLMNRAVWANPDREVIEYLVKKKVSLNTVDGELKQTPLMILAQRPSPPWVFELLLKSGANPNLEDATGRTALDYLDQNKYLKTSTIRKTLKDAMKK